MPLTFPANGASGGQFAATEAATLTVALPTGATTGDLVLFLVVVGANTTWQTHATWTLEGQATNPNGAIHTAAIYSRVLQAGDTAPTFTANASGKRAWVGIAWRPGASETPSVYAKATTLISAATTTVTPNAVNSTDANSVSLVFNSNRAQTSGATGITQTPPTSPAVYTEPTNGDQSTAIGTTNATRQVGAHLTYRTAVGSGSIAPGAHVFNVSVIDIAFHYLLRSASAGTNLANLGVAQAHSTQNVVLDVVAAVDRRPKILGQSFVPIEQSTW